MYNKCDNMHNPIIKNTKKNPTAKYAKNNPIVTKSDSSGSLLDSFVELLLVKAIVTFSIIFVRFITLKINITSYKNYLVNKIFSKII
jgi:hypothetical protein